MSNLTTRKIVLGLLMTLVLAFSVQGIAEALTLTETSPVVQSKRMGSTFEISFTVGLTSPTTAYDDESPRRRITDHNDLPASWTLTGSPYRADLTSGEAVRIDSQGYQVLYIGSSAYRFIDDATIRPSGTDTLTSSGADTPAETPATGRYVDTNGNVVDGNGKAVYKQLGSSGSFTYERAKADPQPAVDPEYRSDYNEEMISITSTNGAQITITDKRDGQTIVAAAESTGNMDENNRFGTLQRTVTLICDPSAVGTYVITIADATPARDVPRLDVGRTPAPITFTLHVTPATTDITAGDTIMPDIQRIPTQDAVEPVSAHLEFPMDGGAHKDYRIRYEVVRGSGTLYLGTLEEEHTVPSTALSVHQATNVYLNTNNSSNEVHVWFAGEDRSAPRATIIFEYKGQPVPTTRTTPTTTTTTTTTTTGTPRLTISVSGTGTTRTVTVNALSAAGVSQSGVLVTLSSTNFSLSRAVTTGTPTSVTFPSTAGDYTLLATHQAGVYTQATETVTIGTPTGTGTLTLTIGARNGNQQTITITARRGGSVQNVLYTLTGGLTTYTGRTGTTGSITRIITLPTATSSHTLTVSATEYTTVSATAPAPGQTTTPTTRGPAGEPDSLEIDGQRQISSSLNQVLRLRVRVLDANDNGVSDARVTFRVLSPARGTFAGARGTGRAVLVETDRNGYASTNFTPTTDGDVIVRASTGGVSPVTFILDVSGTTDTTTDTRVPDPGVSRITVDIDDTVVHVGAAHRPPMLWVDGGKIYALVGANVQEFGSGIENALNIAVGGGKVYWTEMTGESAGTINSANLNGSGVTELASILAVPMGIAVDATNSKLYWTNSRGRIQTANLDGSGISNVLQNLPGPMDIAVARGNLYWTQYDETANEGNVGIVNPNAAQRIARYISTDSDSPGSLAINGSKVYWTEMTGTNSGTINSANLTGTGKTELASILAAPSGIAVDGSRSKLYWTNSRGRIQSANLDGSKIQNVVGGLGSPGDMVLSNSITAPVATTTTTTTTTTSDSKYDVNGDGSVDNMDAGLVADALGTSNAKYDVNGDGTVNFLDLLLVFDNRDDDAAGAPTIVGMQMTAAQVDILQEQIDLLIASGDRSPVAIRTLIYLQQLIATARPQKTQLLANYPNPFNPETWIPYELATDTTVKITIYNTQGVVIRTLELGHQSAGYYTGRDRAAYWDGRNALGEQVASGIYFYQFETDEMSSMRKMVILK